MAIKTRCKCPVLTLCNCAFETYAQDSGLLLQYRPLVLCGPLHFLNLPSSCQVSDGSDSCSTFARKFPERPSFALLHIVLCPDRPRLTVARPPMQQRAPSS